jgi:hypothetical protein
VEIAAWPKEHSKKVSLLASVNLMLANWVLQFVAIFEFDGCCEYEADLYCPVQSLASPPLILADYRSHHWAWLQLF